MRIRAALLIIVALQIAPLGRAGQPPRAGDAAAIFAPASAAAPTAPAPARDARWAGGMLIVIAAAFLAAAVIGPLYRSSLPEALPEMHAHDEPPGASRHHGPSGTIEHEES